MALAGARHGDVANRIAFLITAHTDAPRLGDLFAADAGSRIRSELDTVRALDGSFVAREGLPSGDIPSGYIDLAPDLVI